ncbi:hypothetical protein CASFOL_004247 [Castilleja foliolosa]|uniref:Uncharacterized protein n=1 Tax=Castilleja foliolosa TaxID=1961234 RepID=A0ABD3E9X4_9LAMI
MPLYRHELRKGSPLGTVKEFDESSCSALLVRKSFTELHDNIQLVANLFSMVNSQDSRIYGGGLT